MTGPAAAAASTETSQDTAPPRLRVAVIGSGPGGLYTAEALIKQVAARAGGPDVEVDVLDRLPTPYGLVRYGVAPDHTSIKSIAGYLRRVLEHPQVRFFGGVRFGPDVTRDELLACYDAVVYATGAMRDRRLGVPGEDLPGSVAATDFVNWYCGHPDIDPAAFSLDAESVAVIGVGNVAVDVARILAKTAAELSSTDVPEPVLAALAASKVREIHMIGRRGPAQAKQYLRTKGAGRNIAVLLEVRQGRGHGRQGDAVGDRRGADAPPALLGPADLLGEVRVEQQVGQLGIAVERLLDLSQESAADDAAAPPHQGHAAVVDLPVRLLGHGVHQAEALGVGDDLAGVEGLLEVVDHGLQVAGERGELGS